MKSIQVGACKGMQKKSNEHIFFNLIKYSLSIIILSCYWLIIAILRGTFELFNAIAKLWWTANKLAYFQIMKHCLTYTTNQHCWLSRQSYTECPVVFVFYCFITTLLLDHPLPHWWDLHTATSKISCCLLPCLSATLLFTDTLLFRSSLFSDPSALFPPIRAPDNSRICSTGTSVCNLDLIILRNWFKPVSRIRREALESTPTTPPLLV